MIQIETAVTIDRPIGRTFEFIATRMVENARKWNPNITEMEQVTPGPLGVGTRVREVQLVQGKPHGRVFEVARFDPDRLIELRGVSSDVAGEHFLARYAFSPDADRTRVDFRLELFWPNFMFKYLRPLVRFFIAKDVKAIVNGRIKQLVEAA